MNTWNISRPVGRSAGRASLCGGQFISQSAVYGILAHMFTVCLNLTKGPEGGSGVEWRVLIQICIISTYMC